MAKSIRIAVVGGSGFLGNSLANELANSGYEVLIYDVCKPKSVPFNQRYVQGDLLDVASLDIALSNIDYVFHCGGIADIKEASKDPIKTIEVNVLGTTILLDSCVKNKVKRVFFASTMYVYSDQGSFYRASKQAAELLIKAYLDKHDLKYTVLRYGSLYGIGSQDWNGMSKYITQAINEGEINYIGTKKDQREYVNIVDAVKLTISTMSDEYINKYVAITGMQKILISDLFDMISEILNKDLKIIYQNLCDSHYTVTPYRYKAENAEKLVPNSFVDLGQGLVEMIEDIYNKGKDKYDY